MKIKIKYLYLFLALVGIIYPYYYFVPYYLQNGFPILEFINEARPNLAAKFLVADLSVTAITALIFIIHDGIKSKTEYWWVSVFGVFMIGVSFALPFYLFLKESKN